MAHLAANQSFLFSVKVQAGFRELECGNPVWGVGMPKVSEQVGHGGGGMKVSVAEREAADGAYLLFELTGVAGVDGQVA